MDLWVGWSIQHLTDKTQTPRLIFSSNDMTCKIEERTRLFNIDGERFPRSNPNGKWWRRWLCRIKEHIWESVLHAKSLSTSALTSTLQMFPNVLHAKSQWTQTGIIAIITSRLIKFFSSKSQPSSSTTLLGSRIILQWLRVSNLEMAIASPSFASLFFQDPLVS